MEFSQHYYIRKEKMKNLQVPTISEVKEQMGDKFSNVWFDLCPESLRGEMSIASRLEGPGEDLWISPSDILINKVVLKPPLTNKHMKALTHEGILDIGRDIELKFRNEMELEKQKALEDQECVLLFIAEKERNRVIAETIERQEDMFRQKMEDLEEDFQRLLREELEKLENYLKEVYEQVLEEKTIAILEDQEKHWNENCQSVVKEAMDVLTRKFIEDLENQEHQLTEIFTMKILGQEEKYKQLIKNQQDVFQVLLRQVKHNLQCNNFANLMYVLCVERRKSLIEQQFIVDDYDSQVRILRSTNERQTLELSQLTAEKDRKAMQCQIREECLLSVIGQFQKFINYVLKATPTQAEFLLSVQKMMMFELTQAIAATARGENRRHMKMLMPWRRKSQISVLGADYSNVVAPDFHNCLNELPIPVENESQQSIPTMKYREKLYVREDFRNKISQGFPIRASSMIWNKDMENLITLLNKKISESDVVDDSMSPNGSIRVQRSSVRFGYDEHDASYDLNLGLLAAHDSFDLQKTLQSNPSSTVIEICVGGGVDILATHDSLTLANVDKMSKYSATNHEYKRPSIDTIQLRKEMDHTSNNKTRKKSIETLQLYKDSSRISIKAESMKYEPKPKTTEKKPVKKDSATFKSKPGHRDSLDIIRKDLQAGNKRLKDILTLADSHYRDQEVTHLALSLPYDSKSLDIEFSRVAETFTEMTEIKGEPWKIYQNENVRDTPAVSQTRVSMEKPVSRKDTFLTKPAAAKIIGNYGKEHLQSSKDFTIHRIHSIVDILKKDDSLIRIFTGCSH